MKATKWIGLCWIFGGVSRARMSPAGPTLKRYRSQRLRPPTRRTQARPTGFSRASKSVGPGSTSAAQSILTVRPTASDLWQV